MISVEFIWVRSKFLCAIKKIICCLADVVALSRIFVMPCKSIYFTKGSVRACSAHCWLMFDPKKFEFGVRFDSWIHIWSLVAPCSVWHLLELNTCALERQKLSSKVIELMFLSMFRYATLILANILCLCREGYPKCCSCPKEYSPWCCWPCS